MAELSLYLANLTGIFSIITAILGIRLILAILSKKKSPIQRTIHIIFGLLVISFISWASAETIWAILSIMGIDPAFGIAEYFYLFGYLCSAIALIYFAKINLSHSAFEEIFSVSVIGGLFILFALFSVNFVVSGYVEKLPALEMFLSYFYPIGSAILFALSSTVYIFFRKIKIIEIPLILIAAGYIFNFVGDLGYTYYSLREIYGTIGIISDICFMIQYLLVAKAFCLLISSLSNGNCGFNIKSKTKNETE
ncbi:MAG: hypothetical protein WC471_01470 [Candidatus Woesearchaeota archaeon]